MNPSHTARRGFALPALLLPKILPAFAAALVALGSLQAAPASARVTSADPALEAIWHLHAGLNVAVLSCRGSGRTSVEAPFSRMLTRHRATFTAAYQAEQRRHGARGFDRHQTQLYNGFAFQRSPATFCSTASSIATRVAAMDSASLGKASQHLLAELGAGS